MIPNLDWMDHAACAQIGGDWWYPEDGSSYTTAKAICGTCPVRQECTDHAQRFELDLSHRSRHGAWGGLDPRRRAQQPSEGAREHRDAEIRRLSARGLAPSRIAAELDVHTRTVLRVLKRHTEQLGEAA